jgi:uncharacterized protein (UPF0332 family)
MFYAPQVILGKAKESYEAAAICLQAKHFNVTASRSYYACVQLATFALLKNRISFNEAHSSIHEAFRQRFCGETPKLAGILEELFGLRMTADYYDRNTSRVDAHFAYARAVEFRNYLEKYL